MKHTSFRQAYGVLQQHAQTLRDQTEPNIDDLLRIVEESVAAYRVCQTRIDAVEKALEKALGESASTEEPRTITSPRDKATVRRAQGTDRTGDSEEPPF